MPLGCPVCVPLERPRADAGLILFAFESRCALGCESGPARRAEPGRVIKEKRERPSRSQGGDSSQQNSSGEAVFAHRSNALTSAGFRISRPMLVQFRTQFSDEIE